MEQQAYVVRANKGAARIWIEGARLARAGFTRGVRYDIASGELLGIPTGAVVLWISENGKRKVSGHGENPIIDITGKGCQPFQTGDAVLITYDSGMITIKRA